MSNIVTPLNILADVTGTKPKIINKKVSNSKKYKCHAELLVNGEIYQTVSWLTEKQKIKAKKSIIKRGMMSNSVQLSVTIDGITRTRTTPVTDIYSMSLTDKMVKLNKHWTKIA